MYKVVDIDDAKTMVKEKYSKFSLDSEVIKVEESLGRTLFEEVVSKENVPHFNRSTVDGYSVISSETASASASSEILFDLVETIEIDDGNIKTLNKGECIYVPTGGMLPNKADSVVMIENTETLGDSILVGSPVSKYENVLLLGQDTKIGEAILEANHQVRPQDIGLMKSLGINEIKVYKRVKVAIISTGDEIVDPATEVLPLGKIRDINSYTLSSLLERLGANVVFQTVLLDDEDLLRNTIKEVEADIVLVSGGSSVGFKDNTFKVFEELGEVFVHGVAIKPGKPTIFGSSDKILIGLPGHPTSCLVVANVFLPFIINNLMGIEGLNPYIKMPALENLIGADGRAKYEMVKVENIDGELYAKPIRGKSGMISLMTRADGYVIINRNQEGIIKNKKVKVYLFK